MSDGGNVILLRPQTPIHGGDRHTVRGILEWYRDGPLLTRKTTSRTRDNYARVCTRIIGYVDGGHLAPVPTAVDWRLLQTHMLVQSLAPTTINWHYRVIRTMLVESVGDTPHGVRLIGELAACRELVITRRPPRAPPEDCVKRIIEGGALRHQGELAWCLLLWESGLRRDEGLALRPSDFERPRALLHVRRQRHREARKQGDTHAVFLRPAVADALLWCIEHWQQMRAGAHGGPRDCHHLHRYIFPWGHTYLTGLGRRIRASLGQEADVYFPKGVLWHAFRHGGASQLARREGATPWQVQAYLGDRSLEMAGCYTRSVGAEAARGALFDGSQHDAVMHSCCECNFSENSHNSIETKGK